MSLPTGTWSLNANGSTRTLAINGIGSSGKLDIALQGIPIIGFWDGKSQRILFHNSGTHEIIPGKMEPFQQDYLLETFVGYLLELNREPMGMAPTLAGYYNNKAPSQPSRETLHHKKTYGWYAQLDKPQESEVLLKNIDRKPFVELIRGLI